MAQSNTNINDINISDENLLKLGVKDLNKLLKSLSPENRSKLKKRRRILKNRGYAANCRTKRMSQKEYFQIKKIELENDIKQISDQNQSLKAKLDSIKERYKDLQHYVTILKSSDNPK